MSVPRYLNELISISYQMVNSWWIGLIVLAGGLGLFEWRCASENKALIRTAMGVAASLVCVAFALFVAGAAVVSMILVQAAAVEQRSEPAVVARVVDAHRSYDRLGRAIVDEDWATARDSAREMEDAYRILRELDTVPMIFASKGQWDNVEAIRRLLDDVVEQSDELEDAIRGKDLSAIEKCHAELQASYATLKKKSTFFADQVHGEAGPKGSDEDTSSTEPTTGSEPETRVQ
jgi:hypothetical protein